MGQSFAAVNFHIPVPTCRFWPCLTAWPTLQVEIFVLAFSQCPPMGPLLHFDSYWSERQDSNLRPSGPKPDALPDCATLRSVQRKFPTPMKLLLQARISLLPYQISITHQMWLADSQFPHSNSLCSIRSPMSNPISFPTPELISRT